MFHRVLTASTPVRLRSSRERTHGTGAVTVSHRVDERAARERIAVLRRVPDPHASLKTPPLASGDVDTTSHFGSQVACAAAVLLLPSVWVLAPDHRADLLLGATSLVLVALNVLLVARFFMSYFPRLERLRSCEHPWMGIAALSDPILQPVRNIFRHNDGDLDISAAALLGFTCIVQELLYGSSGILLHETSSAAVQYGLQFVVMTQQGMLLPIWFLTVFRWMSII